MFFSKNEMLYFHFDSDRSWTVYVRLLWLLVSGSSWRELPICWRESAPCCQTRHILMLLSSSPTLHSSLNWPALVTPSMLLLITTLFPCTRISQVEPHPNLYEWTQNIIGSACVDQCAAVLHTPCKDVHRIILRSHLWDSVLFCFYKCSFVGIFWHNNHIKIRFLFIVK